MPRAIQTAGGSGSRPTTPMADAPPNPRFLARKRPVHPLPVDYTNRCAIIFLTVCTRNRQAALANESAHRHFLAAVAASRSLARWAICNNARPYPSFLCPGRDSRAANGWLGQVLEISCDEKPGRRRRVALADGLLDSQLRRRENYEAKWDYVCNNPVRAGLVQDGNRWPFQGEMNELRWRE